VPGEHHPRHPNFRFQIADIRNKEYNMGGRFAASEDGFPYADSSFDFVLLTSVLACLLPNEAENQLLEIRWVLVPGGRGFASFSLLNEESLDFLRVGRSIINAFPKHHLDPNHSSWVFGQGCRMSSVALLPVDGRVCFVVDWPAMLFEPKVDYSTGRGAVP
jgi:SAM-dependent methyltransferase